MSPECFEIFHIQQAHPRRSLGRVQLSFSGIFLHPPFKLMGVMSIDKGFYYILTLGKFL